ncbi:MAG: hypothetical protein M3Z31_17700 [Pseudomonadota bacterium]|nr:hypothetical protein [Pseudomonadota bacterium]
MPNPPQDATPENWHRFFAMSANNLAWRLAGERRDDTTDADMLNAAHASAWHWGVIGTELNRMRATMLLAHVHAVAGHGERAFAYASQMHEYFLARPETPDWEVAFTHAIHAQAAHAAGHPHEHARSYASAKQAIAAIVQEEDRAIVEETFVRLAAP